MKFLIRLICICFLFYSCKEERSASPIKENPSENSTIKTQVKNEIQTAKPIDTDTINRTNTVAFLTAYGKQHPETEILLETRLGNIIIKLYRDTPLHRASFIFLTKTGYFSTTCVHRVVEGFVVQGGNSEHPKTRKFRRKYDQYTLPAEFKKHRKHYYGALAAARDWENNPTKRSNPFEFYFIQDPKGGHHIDGEHTVFGEIISGFDTLEKIALVEVGGDEWPVKDVFFKATVLR